MNINRLDRRDWFCLAGLQGLACVLPSRSLGNADAPALALEPLNRFPRMVQESFVQQVRAAEQIGQAARFKLKTKADAEGYVRTVRGKIAECFGPFPEKTPLNAKVTGKVERDDYVIEKVIFESRPGFPVTANLYVPKGRKFSLPGVVGSCGHSVNGKAADAYQGFSQSLARQGYIVLIFDPIGQGERLQYTHLDKKHRPKPSVGEHMHAGNQQFLVGEFFGSWRAWDGIRALDYLLSRPEVDPKHVGITGNSGGGTMTTWLCGVEKRWTMAAPACFVTTFRRNLENELPADTEQCPPKVLALGLDHADFLAALAPKPIVILAKEKDYFDVRGATEAYERLRDLYTLLGQPNNIKLHVGPTGHGYSQENREAMYQWFNGVTGISDAKTEAKLTVEKDATLWCTPTGQVAEFRPRTVFSFTQEKAKSLQKVRATEKGNLPERVGNFLKLPERSGPPDYRILRAMGNRKYPKPHATTYAVETEPGIQAVVTRLAAEPHISRPSHGKNRAILYIAHHSSDAELRDEPLIAELLKAEPDATFYACDVRGIGDSRPDTCGPKSFLTPYGSDYFYAIHSIMLDRPYVGRKAFDVLRVIDWLMAEQHGDVHLVGRGWGSIPATLAAMLHDKVAQVTLKNALTSYQSIGEAAEYAWPLSALLPGVLASFDLPDCYEWLQIKKLRQIQPWGPNGIGE